MKDWFPLTSYDFYSYLACGMVFLIGLDYCYTSGQLLRHDWTVFQGTIAIALAYIVGQIIAIPASMIFEHWLVRNILRPPAVVMLSEQQSRIEHFIEKFLIGRHYSPLPKNVIHRIYNRAQEETNLSHTELQADVYEVIAPALVNARNSQETTKRIDFFRNQYSFSRNVSFSSLLVFFFLCDSSFRLSGKVEVNAILFSIFVCIGMFVRFLKFYSSTSAEVLRSYAKQHKL